MNNLTSSSQSQSISFGPAKAKEKQVFQIVSDNVGSQSNQAQGLSLMGKPKTEFQMSSNHQGNTTSSTGQGISFIPKEKPQLVPVTNAMSFEGKKAPIIKRSNPSEYKISSNSNNNNNAGIGISFIAPEKKKKELAVSSGISYEPQKHSTGSTSQGLSFIAPDPPKKNKIEFSGTQSVSLQFEGTGVPPASKKKKKKHYEMEWNKKYKKSNPKEYKIESKTINLYFEGKKRQRNTSGLNYILQQLSQPNPVPNMSVKAFFSKKGRRRGGKK